MKTEMPCLLLALLFLSFCSGAAGSDKLVVLPCDRPLFQSQLQLCLGLFNSSLQLTAYRSDCVWPQVKRIVFPSVFEPQTAEGDCGETFSGFQDSYNALKHCVDAGARASWCTGVGSATDRFFLEVHQTFFSECGRIREPPLSALVLMVAPLVISTLLLPMLCVHLTTRDP